MSIRLQLATILKLLLGVYSDLETGPLSVPYVVQCSVLRGQVCTETAMGDPETFFVESHI